MHKDPADGIEGDEKYHRRGLSKEQTSSWDSSSSCRYKEQIDSFCVRARFLSILFHCYSYKEVMISQVRSDQFNNDNVAKGIIFRLA